MKRLFREHTPVETYNVGTRRVFVKREDTYGIAPAPALAKLRGMRLLLREAHERGVRLIGCWDTRVSKLGQGLAACCTEFSDLRCVVSFPSRDDEPPPPAAEAAAKLGAELFRVPPARINICFAQARRHVQERNGYMLPFGLECPQAVASVAREAATLDPALIRNGTLVLCCGSGVTLAGLLRGLPARPRRIIGISSGRSRENILRCVRRYVSDIPTSLEFLPPDSVYREALAFPCPFPSHPHYDLKAWKYLVETAPRLREPILFWNIGA